MRRLVSCLLTLLAIEKLTKAEFDPYQLNGGLVSAVAGRDYVVVATDTRLTDGGYEILSRSHVSSRLWSPWVSTHSIVTHEEEDKADTGRKGPLEEHDAASPSHGDGSARIPSEGTSRTYTARHPPVWIASSGCSTDCEQLKRLMRSRLRAATYFHPHSLEEIPSPTGHAANALPSSSSATCAAPSVANLLSQTLYSRRGFPFYAFCVLAGMSDDDDDDESSGGGHVCVYDAIGSYERVSVATAGTGREILQPILDRRFDSELTVRNAIGISTSSVDDDSGSDGELGVAHPLRSSFGLHRQRVYPTHVTCTAPEAVEILREAYEAVSEREIGVGDQLLVCVVRKKRRQRDDSFDVMYETQFLTFPLKKH